MNAIQQIFTQFDPTEPLEADDPRYVDCNAARGVPAVFQSLSLPLTLKPPKTLLFSGNIGDGKTTLLKQLEKQLEDDNYFVTLAPADERLNTEDVEVEDVILLILAIVGQSLQERYGASFDDNILTQKI